ncbi:DUF4412 domain-containing protein [Cellulophaga baltica]|uniref:DUF4412 domain-containing protein n=1 Tax=Cellulophaga baltica TaxID=76594 RepID=UPI002493F61F|nr:DUF4412 domain-containing protein [Cellulophaga baltica]
MKNAINYTIIITTLRRTSKVLASLIMFISTNAITAQSSEYTFDYIYKMQIENPNGKKTVIDYYLPASGGYFCSKAGDNVVVVYDNNENKMYTYMGEDDEKIVMSMPFNLKGLVEEYNDFEDPRVYEAAGYGNILDYDCQLFRMTSNNLTSEVWIATGVTEGSFGENVITPEFFGYFLARSLNVGDDSLKAVYSGLPLKIVSYKKRGAREKITTMECIEFARSSFKITSSEYRRL